MSVDALAPTKASWADEVENEEGGFAPEVFTDENGIKTIIEYRQVDGKTIKVTRRIRIIKEHLNKAVAERKKWAKFGDERGNQTGPDSRTTTEGENVGLKLASTGGKHADIAATVDEDPDLAIRAAILKNKKILCRICKGDHFTSKCPYKDSLQPLDEILDGGKDGTPDRAISPEPSTATGPKKYIAPHMRNAGSGTSANAGESMGREKRDDSATIRVTNLSEDVTEADIHDLFRRFGQIARVYLARDRETNVCKGFAFVSFQNKDDAGRALQAINGYGYDNLILRVEWANSNK